MKLRSFIFITLIVCVLFFNWSERVTGNGFQEPTKHVEGVKESEVTNNSTPSQSPGLREYRFLATNQSSTMEKELNQLADQGFGLELVAKEWNGSNLVMSDTFNNRIQGRFIPTGSWMLVGAPNNGGTGVGSFRNPGKIR